MSMFLKTIGILYAIAAVLIFVGQLNLGEPLGVAITIGLIGPAYAGIISLIAFPPAWFVIGAYFLWCIFVYKPTARPLPSHKGQGRAL